ncbi:MAG: cation-transporting P-type ATPase [Ruminococcaceae bacterium]|nr:cation-transporting P-type ATPase [Oscillospiraceae bacterium]
MNMSESRNTSSGIRTFVLKDEKNGSKKILSPAYMKIYEVIERLNTNTEKGLSFQTVQKRRKKTGLNLLYPEFKRTFVSAFMDHIKSVVSILLALSLFVFFAFYRDASYLICAFLVSASVFFDCVLEHIASLNFKKARKSASLKTHVKRNGKLYLSDSRFLVPGDLVFLQKGSIVPADVRLFESNALSVLETPINGVEAPVSKIARDIGSDEVLDDSAENMAYAGSIVCEGSGWGIVCFVGADTKFNSVPKNKHNNVPAIFKYVYSVSSMLSISSSFFGVLMLVLGLFFSSHLSYTFLFSLAVAFCSFCDTLVSFAALSFSSGLCELNKKGAVLRNLSAIEPLAFTDSLLVRQNTVFPINKTEVEGIFLGLDDVTNCEQEKKILKYFLICSNVEKKISKNGNKKFAFEGRQNAVATAIYSEKAGIDYDSLRDEFLITESDKSEGGEFSYLLAYESGQKYLFVKGMAADVLQLCKYHETMQGIKTITQNDMENYYYFASSQTNDTGYVVALAKCETGLDRLEDYDDRKVLTLCGFIRFKTYFGIDYLKDVSECKKAGIDICMFSSDAYMKAYNLGRNYGIFQKNDQVVAEEMVNASSYEEFLEEIPKYKLFMYFSPSVFKDVIIAKKAKGSTVAVTAESTADLNVMKNADISFVVDSESSEMIKQSSDVILSSGGFDKLNVVISGAKKIYRRIHSLCEFGVYNYICFLLLYFFGSIFGIEYRVHDFLISSVLISGIVSCFIAVCKEPKKQYHSSLKKRKKTAEPRSFAISLVLGIECSICCTVVFLNVKGNAGFSSVLITFAIFAIVAALTILNEGKPFYKSLWGLNWSLAVMLVLLALLLLAIIAVPLFANSLSYGLPIWKDVAFSVVFPILVHVLNVFALKFIDKQK